MTYEQVLASSAALLNDQERQVYTDAVLLAYLNIALAELQEMFELNNIPSTNEESTKIDVPIGQSTIGFPPAIPVVGTAYLPSNLTEIRRLYCSSDGQNNWIGPVTKQEFITGDILPGGSNNTFFNTWSWEDQEIRVIASITPLDIKLDYIKTLFPIPMVIGDIDDDLTILNSASFLQYRVAGLASDFIEENESRADKHNTFALASLDRSLGISVKSKQSIVSRRRPFRASFKRRGILI